MIIKNESLVSSSLLSMAPMLPCFPEIHRLGSHFYLSVYLSICLSIYLFMAALGLRCWVRAFSSCGEQGLLFVAVRGLLIAVASPVAEHGL